METCNSGDLVNGSPWAVIWHMSRPLTLNMLALSAMNLFEGWIAGRLGTEAQAAVGVGGQLWFLFMMMTLAMASGTTAIVSRYCGAQDIPLAVKAGRQALVCALMLSIVATTIGLTFCRSILESLGASDNVEDESVAYLNMCLLSMVPYTMLWITNAIFRSSGDARTPMITMILVFASIMICEFFLCQGPLHIGIRGIGISWTACSLAGTLINLLQLRRSKLRAICNCRELLQEGISAVWLKRFLAIGIPACVQDLALIGGSLGMFVVLSKTHNPQTAQAAWAAGWRLEETLTLMPMYGLNLAAAAIVGQNLGASLPGRAAACGWRVMALGLAANVLVALTMWSLAPQIAAWLCANQSVSSCCEVYLRTVCWTEPFFACWRILAGAMEGAGYTWIPMLATVFSFSIVRVSLAVLSLQFASATPQCMWASMAASTVLAGTIMIYFWHRGNWKAQRV